MKKSQFKLVAILALCLVSHVRAADQQKGGQALLNRPKNTAKVADVDCQATQAVPSNVFSYQKTGQSHIKSLGQIGKTARYEIVSVKVRGLDTPNVSAFLIYDSNSDTIIGMQSAGAPGLGVALVNGGASIAGNFLFGANIRPSTTEVVAASISDSSAKSDNHPTTSTTTTVNNPTPASNGHPGHNKH